MASPETNLPSRFDPSSGSNIKWSATLGTESHGTPIVANGRVYVGTNNGQPRDPKHQGDRGVLMCFAESTGQLLWQLVVPKREEDPYHDWPNSGISSPVTVEGDRVYLVNNRGEVLCLDASGLTNGNDGPFLTEGLHMTPRGTNAPPTPLLPGPLDADILWRFDLTTNAGIWSHDAAHSSILIHGPHLYLNTGTGVDNTHKRIRTPMAPSLVVLDKASGSLLARDMELNATNIFHCTWSSPSLALVHDQPRLFFAGGDGILYAYHPLPWTNPPPSFNASSNSNPPVQALKKIFHYDPDPAAPKSNVHHYNRNRRESPSNIYGMPVFHQNRIYLAGGGDLFWGKIQAWLHCVDATQSGNVTDSARLWSYPLLRHVIATPAVHNGLVYIADCGRTVHCIDASSGQPLWTHETQGEIWASPLIADGKVFVGTRRGDFWIFTAGREKKILGTTTFDRPISATATAANGVLYITTMTHLYAISNQP